MASGLNMSHGKMSDFVSFLLFEFTLVIKQRHFDFDDVRFEYVLPNSS